MQYNTSESRSLDLSGWLLSPHFLVLSMINHVRRTELGLVDKYLTDMIHMRLSLVYTIEAHIFGGVLALSLSREI